MRTRNFIVITVLMLVCASLMSSVGQSEAKTVKIRILGLDAWKTTWLEGGAGKKIDKYDQFAEELKAQGVELEWNLNPWQGFDTKAKRLMTSPRPTADVFGCIIGWLGPEMFENLEPLDAYMEADPIENFEDISPGAVVKYQGKTYGIPFRTLVDPFYYNTQMYQERLGTTAPPETFEQVIEFAKKLTYDRPDGAHVYGYAINTGYLTRGPLLAHGIKIVDDDFNINVNTPETIEVLKKFAELYEMKAIPPNFDTIVSGDMRNLMSQGLAAQLTSGIDEYADNMGNPEASIVADQIAYIPVPPSEKLDQPVAPIYTGGWAWYIPKAVSEDKKQAAWKFIKQYCSPEYLLLTALNGNFAPRASVANSAEYKEVQPIIEIFPVLAKYAELIMPIISQQTECLDAFNEEAANAIKGKKTAEQAMQDAEAKILAILQRAGLK